MRAVRILVLAGAATLLLTAQADPSAADRARLAEARRAQAAALQRARALEAGAERARDAAARARVTQAAVAARVTAAQAETAAAEASVALIERRLAFERSRLAERQAPTLRLVAALQALARRPAIAAIAQPGSTADLVHVRAALASVVPVVAARSAELRRAVERADRLRIEASGAARALADGRAALERERIALVRAESESRLRSVALERTALVESDRALALGEDARDIVDQMELAGIAADTRASLERLDGPLPRPGARGVEVQGEAPYRLPVAGQLVTGLGEVSDNGVRARGLTVATWPGAIVVAPAAGRVVFARAFRSYGGVVILAHGDGWSSLVSGLERASVERGDRVAAGDPIGRAPAGAAPRITTELRRRGVPIDLVALLR
ncbi:murein hydrolase activator EnvC family protein [Sphingomonas japonica]|uniref:Septal ring factor EnvC (AmiA/AmiB activator) n=1 Tax=Sphingomonas japonica TaxID=511662 RepID=A0ABX0TZR4_9SPHN|nr:peptidoglycan DD-metalloendopeptidase family protein [Sphingomonas japonica]NIJ23335.1 septal ring factor EnvC (AmiA/AmiB activator) [Sphingomonas japonica]